MLRGTLENQHSRRLLLRLIKHQLSRESETYRPDDMPVQAKIDRLDCLSGLLDEFAARLAEAGNITPAISVEGFETETDTRRGEGVHGRIMKAFDALRRHGVPFGVSATATRHNWDGSSIESCG